MYEIEFHRVGNGDNSGDAISLRYWDGLQWRVGIVDSGYEENGEALCDHIRTHYQTEMIDFAVSTHPDNDHMSGLRSVLEQMQVRQLWMHVPFAHAERIHHLFRSRRWLLENLQRELRLAYPMVEELIDICARKGTELQLPFQGSRIGPFVVLSPTVGMYEGLLPQFRCTPQPDVDVLQQLGHWIAVVGRRYATKILFNVFEDWTRETLKEGGITSAENESSVILLGIFENDRILLTGDAGLVALAEARRYATAVGIDMTRPRLFQVPHHGSRNNISPSMLDFIVGLVLPQGQSSVVRSIVSCGAEDTTHPRQVVVNALARRGSVPQSTRDGSMRFSGNGMPKRAGWDPAPSLEFKALVEEYDS